MQKIVYLLVYPLLWGISKLPFPIFYLVSDALFVLFYDIVGYRKKVVRHNLTLSFPEKSSKERKEIEKKFYQHLCDMFLEMIKTLSISKKQLKKRFVYTNIEALANFEKESKGVIVMCGHYASYEWATAINFYDTHNKGYAIYKKLKNYHFDKLIKKIRANLGTTLISSKEVVPTMMRNIRDDVKGSYYMISDQCPKKNNLKHWVSFIEKETPVFVGAEAMAKKLNLALMYLHVEKIKRGYYTATLEPLAKNPRDFEDYTITELFFKKLEAQIRQQPEYYLWTHKRWKYSKNK